jgi:hypothetical protein
MDERNIPRDKNAARAKEEKARYYIKAKISYD